MANALSHDHVHHRALPFVLSTLEATIWFNHPISDNSVQLEGFLLYTTESPTVPETLLYNNSLYPYDEGIFIIEVQPPQIVQSVTVRRPSGTILVLCEMEVFGGTYFIIFLCIHVYF